MLDPLYGIVSDGILDALPLPSLAIDLSERIAAANTEARTLIGQRLVGRNYVTMLRQPALLDAVEATLRDGERRHSRYFSNDGAHDTTFDVSCRAIKDLKSDTIAYVLLCFSDVSYKEQAGQMRRDFVANVSHELRTPLTSVMGFIETLRGPARGDVAATDRFLDIMDSEAQRMNRLVGDLLSLSRVESDERVRPTTQIELVGILQSVVRSLGPLAREAGIEVTLDSDCEDVALIGDADQLMQVFMNLVENAVKYGGTGERITIRLRASDREPALRAPGVRVQVIDYGSGIDPVHLPRLTERFYRVDDHRSRALGGTGLGLAIVKHIISRHRGRLRVESTLGEGATFTTILPVEDVTPKS